MYTFLSFMFPLVIGVIVYATAVYISEKDCNALGSKAQLKKQNEILTELNSEYELKIKKLFSEKAELKRELLEKITGFSRTELHFINQNIIENIERGTKIEVVSNSYKMIEKINKILEETDV